MTSLLLSLAINAVFIFQAGGQPAPCCTRKTVGGVHYNLVNEMNTAPYNCLSNCIYEKTDRPGSKFCFASGELVVDCGDSGEGDRQLICNYLPKTDVMEHWKIDLDQKDFQHFLDNDDFIAAEDIYTNGANSMKTSEITLGYPLTQDFSKGAVVSQAGAEGVLNADAYIGNLTIKVGIKPPCVSQYAQNPDTSGCFTDNSGSLTIEGVDLGSPASVNLKYRNLKKFSTEAGDKMEGKDTFEKYKAYYGKSDYADKFITAALQGLDETGLNVAIDFSDKDDDYRIESAKKGSAFWSVWLYLIWEMEDAIGDCNNDCVDNCNDAPVHAWDEAWAFYTGSLEGPYGNVDGILSYRLAETLCNKFGTCLAGKSVVNRELVTKFLDGKSKLDQGKCNEAHEFKKDIITAMSIPLIQGTLQSAYKIAQGDSSSKTLAEGVSFVGSIIPQLHNCSSVDAATVMDRMWIDGDMVDADGFRIVKEAFERNYACMGVTCGDIGQYVGDQTGGCTADGVGYPRVP